MSTHASVASAGAEVRFLYTLLFWLLVTHLIIY